MVVQRNQRMTKIYVQLNVDSSFKNCDFELETLIFMQQFSIFLDNKDPKISSLYEIVFICTSIIQVILSAFIQIFNCHVLFPHYENKQFLLNELD